jgi:hypothetical protein
MYLRVQIVGTVQSEGSLSTYVCILCVQIVGTVRRPDVGLVLHHYLGAFCGGALWRLRCY